jgi:hypothetical protein
VAVRHLFGKFQREIAVVQQQKQRDEKKQTHEKIEDAITLAARVLNIFHVSNSNCSDAKSRAKI